MIREHVEATTNAIQNADAFDVIELMVEEKPGKEQEVWDFLNGGREIVLDEPGTRTWYAFRASETTLGIFDTFDTEEDRQAHLNGAIPTALSEHGPAMLAGDPNIRMIELIAVK
ncbi:putative quinol monooxygenase [Arthrobacter sp. R4-81]